MSAKTNTPTNPAKPDESQPAKLQVDQEAAAKAKAEEEAAAKAQAEEEAAAAAAAQEPEKPKKGDRVRLEVPVNGGRTRRMIGTCTKAANKDGVLRAVVELGAPPQGPKQMEYEFHPAGTPRASYFWLGMADQ